ncbi:hypothetical protein IP70_10715 [alpha proteobacterium AAP38]|nr:hypothetical protein IP70_10715 [alpha proteobacterium AAP38]
MLVLLVSVGPVWAASAKQDVLKLALETPLTDLPKLPVDGPITPPPEPAEAAELLRQGREAAELTNGSIDVAAALTYFRKAASKGSFEATAEYAYLLRTGGAPPEQKANSITITRYLAAHGHQGAAAAMGMLGFMGRLGPEDGATASKYWFNIARRAGNADAIKTNNNVLTSLRSRGDLPPGVGDGDRVETAFAFTGITTTADGAAAVEKTMSTLFKSGWTQVGVSSLTAQDKTFARHLLADDKGREIAVFFDTTGWR